MDSWVVGCGDGCADAWLSNGAPGEVVEGMERERERLLAGERREVADGNV